MTGRLGRWALGLALALGAAAARAAEAPGALTGRRWTEVEKQVLRSLSLASLPPLPADPSNARADDPRAVSLGKKLFFDARLSADGRVSCATCHLPDHSFTDRLPVARGLGQTSRRTMPLLGAAYQAWFFWDGRKDSLWSQALGPLENPAEHGTTRTACLHLAAGAYRAEYEALFGPLPEPAPEAFPARATPTGDPAEQRLWEAMKPEDRETVNRVFANLGKAIAAFVRRIVPAAAPFDRYVEAVLRDDYAAADQILAPDAVEGLALFLGKAECRNCHAGPLFTNGSFHALRIPGAADGDRAEGVRRALADEFNCLGRYSDAAPDQCGEIRFVDAGGSGEAGAFKTPTLRNVADRPPYLHAGQMGTIAEILRHYRGAGLAELEHTELTEPDLARIEAFLRSLSGPWTSP